MNDLNCDWCGCTVTSDAWQDECGDYYCDEHAPLIRDKAPPAIKYASLCFLSYNRFTSLAEAVTTAVADPGFPCETIIHDDGSTEKSDNIRLLASQVSAVSIFNRPGHNEGVGRAINRSFSIATGDYLLKLDQDLIFEPGWLAKAISVIDSDPDVGMVGLFKYEHDPVDWRRMQQDVGSASGVSEVPTYHYVKDFVSSALLITRDLYQALGPFTEHSPSFSEDIEYKHRIKDELGLKLALLDEPVCRNVGFGIGPSTVVTKDGTVKSIHTGPWLT